MPGREWLPDVNSVLRWLRNKDDETLDPTGIYEQLDSSLGEKLGQSLEDKAEDHANALNWMGSSDFRCGLISETKTFS